MNYLEYKPTHPLLQSHIEYYNSMQGDGTIGKKFISLPEGKIGMVFLLGGHTKIDNGREVVFNQSSRMWGLIQAANFCEMSNDIFTFCIVFKPGGLFHFLPNVPINDVAKASATLEDIFGKEISKIEDQLFECKNFEQRVQLIEHFLLSIIQPTNVLLQKAVRQIENTASKINVKKLGQQFNISTRQLQNIFNEKIGLAPKQFIRMMRFKKTLSSPPDFHENMAQYANRLGYYDESHFIHEFKMFAGMTPRKYFQNINFISDFSNFKRLMLD
ncbi:MAG TPA: AraC family transcriptional regulator [Saprospiraceae bacterium]|nr:AraC family transcriptional regulator [Saprospiraceae bacterium]